MARFNQMINASISVKVCLGCNITGCLPWCPPLPSPPNDTAFLDPPPENNSSNPSLSPLVIIVVGVLASLFLLVSYYAIIVKFCSSWDLGRNPRRSNNNNNDDDDDDEIEENHQNHPLNQFWYVRTVGLDDSIINSIAVCKYKKDGGLIDGTECTVCLSEFHEDENLRLLPKCSHAFHLPCIDTWLRSHVNCPLCRANIVSNPPPDSTSDQTVSTDPIESDEPPGNHHLGSGNDDRRVSPTTQVAADVNREETEDNSFEGKGKCSSLARERVHSDLAVHETMIDVTMDDEMVQPQPVRRSFSMDESSSSSTVRLALADLHLHRTSSSTAQESPIIGAKSSKFSFGEFSGLKAIILKKHHHAKFKQSGSNNNIVQGGPSLPVSLGKGSGPIAMKRSFSSSNYFLSGCSRSRNSVLPL